MKPVLTILIILLLIAISVGCNILNPSQQEGRYFYNYPDAYEFPTFAPDGSCIAFYRYKLTFLERGSEPTYINDPDSTGIWIMDTNGHNMRMLYKTNPYAGAISFSPDSKFLVFTDSLSFSLIKLNLITREATSLLVNDDQWNWPKFNWSGDYIVATYVGAEQRGLCILDAEGTQLRMLRSPDPILSPIIGGKHPAWLFDNETIIFLSKADPVYTGIVCQIELRV